MSKELRDLSRIATDFALDALSELPPEYANRLLGLRSYSTFKEAVKKISILPEPDQEPDTVISAPKSMIAGGGVIHVNTPHVTFAQPERGHHESDAEFQARTASPAPVPLRSEVARDTGFDHSRKGMISDGSQPPIDDSRRLNRNEAYKRPTITSVARMGRWVDLGVACECGESGYPQPCPRHDPGRVGS